MLYPEELFDENEKGCLIYICKMCNAQEIVKEGAEEHEFCVYKTDLEAKAERMNINPDIVDDPTLAKRTITKCPNKSKECNSNQVVTFYHITSEKFQLIYVCVECKYPWIMDKVDKLYDIASDSNDELD